MAVYSGSAGISQLREKIKQKSKMLVGESAEKVAVFMVESSPLGVEYYRSNTIYRSACWKFIGWYETKTRFGLHFGSFSTIVTAR